MFTKSKQAWVKSYGEKLVFVEGEEPEVEKDEPEKKESGEKKELDLKDMSAAQLLSTIKACIKAANDKMEDEDFSEFMEKVEKASAEYADEEGGDEAPPAEDDAK